jgi:hypothetical protein
MDPRIWSRLPTELIKQIVEISDPTIDSQLAFKIPPKRLDEAKTWRLWYLLKSHDGIVYNLETKSLHIFRSPGYHIIRRPIELSYHTAGLYVFNDTEEEHMVERISETGQFTGQTSRDPWMTELRVLLKGSSIGRCINISGSTF